jgi:homoserine dehydrogenase
MLQEKAEILAQQVGCPLILRRILVRHPQKRRTTPVEPGLLTTRAQDILADPEIDMVVEVIGGESPALEYISQALREGKHVVTANKEVIAKHGPELLSQAQERGVGLRYEASVGGGIPLVAPFQQDLAGNKISRIQAIINGTTNYILTRMAAEGLDFDLALRQAQELGYAESDPSNDIEGIDAAYKLAILATLAFRSQVRPEDVYHEGIGNLAWRDFRYARELGYAIKLLAIAKERDEAIEARVHPAFVPEDFLLAKVDGVFNAVQVEGDLVGKVIFYGEGAGALPTASAIIADVVELARNICWGASPGPGPRFERDKAIRPMSHILTRYYLRMSVTDSAGVLAQISKALGDHAISISSVIQKEVDERAGTAEIVIMTHPSEERAMKAALGEMKGFEVVKEISSFIRVEA